MSIEIETVYRWALSCRNVRYALAMDGDLTAEEFANLMEGAIRGTESRFADRRAAFIGGVAALHGAPVPFGPSWAWADA